MCQEMCGSPFVAWPKREKKAEPTRREKRDEKVEVEMEAVLERASGRRWGGKKKKWKPFEQ